MPYYYFLKRKQILLQIVAINAIITLISGMLATCYATDTDTHTHLS